MKKTSIEELKIVLKKRLSKDSYEHSLRTMDIAIDLADIHGVDTKKAAVAALLHDYARDLSGEELIASSRKAGHNINWVEERLPYLLHAPLGATQVETNLKIDDQDILSAIRKHTYGATQMNPLELTVFLADLIEPSRDGGRIGKVRDEANVDLYKAFKLAYEYQIGKLVAQGRYIHPVTMEVWNKIVDMEYIHGSGN